MLMHGQDAQRFKDMKEEEIFQRLYKEFQPPSGNDGASDDPMK